MSQLQADMIGNVLARMIAILLFAFIPAGTFDYWQGWLYLVVYSMGNSLTLLYLWRHDKPLLYGRLRSGVRAESSRRQKS